MIEMDIASVVQRTAMGTTMLAGAGARRGDGTWYRVRRHGRDHALRGRGLPQAALSFGSTGTRPGKVHGSPATLTECRRPDGTRVAA